VVLTGHSLGGTIAEFVAMKLNLKCESFNSCSSTLMSYLYKKEGPKFNNIVQHHISKDPYSEPEGLGQRINYEIFKEA
jgi:putative lipase involved disintegration of autophagic bodies